MFYEAPARGNRGLRDADGASAFVNVDFGNLPSIHNVESIENEMPLLIESCELRTDGGGPGTHRGGVGMIRKVRLLENEAQYSVLSDRGVIPPWGVLGGGAAAAYHLSIERAGETVTFETPGKVTGFPIFRNDVVVMRSSGGGGYGDPLRRDPALVARDVACGVVSLEAARTVYGVVLDGSASVDQVATTALRAELSAAQFTLRIAADDSFEPYVGAKGKHRIIELAAEDAEALGAGDDDLVEMFGRNPAPLRGWARIVACAQGSVRMDAFGRKVLGIDDGGTIVLRHVPTHTVAKGLAKQNRWE